MAQGLRLTGHKTVQDINGAEGEIVHVQAPDGETLAGRLWLATNKAPLLLVLHGVMSHSLWFKVLASELQNQGISLLAVDRRGAGMTRYKPGEPADDQVLLDDLDAWLQIARTMSEDLHLTGFCWGANYALHGLSRKPPSIRSLILIAPGIVPAKGVEIVRSTNHLSPDSKIPIPLKLEDFTQGPLLNELLRPDPLRLTHTSAGFVGIQNTIGRWSSIRLVRLRLPVLMVLGAEDPISDNTRTQNLLDRSTASPKEAIVVPGLHGVIFDAPEETALACRRWIDRLQS